jgi:hypothetical protein
MSLQRALPSRLAIDLTRVSSGPGSGRLCDWLVYSYRHAELFEAERPIFDVYVSWASRARFRSMPDWLRRTTFLVGCCGLVDLLTISAQFPESDVVQPSQLAESVRESWLSADARGLSRLMRRIGVEKWPRTRTCSYRSEAIDDRVAIARTWVGACTISGVQPVLPALLPDLFEMDSVMLLQNASSFRYCSENLALTHRPSRPDVRLQALPQPFYFLPRREQFEHEADQFEVVTSTKPDQLRSLKLISESQARAERPAKPEGAISNLRQGRIYQNRDGVCSYA